MTPSSLWKKILDRIEITRMTLRKRFEPSDPTDSVAFSISFIALSAKLCKADGQVTRDEVRMFRQIFSIPADEEKNAARVFNLCREEVTGYRKYAEKLNRALLDHPHSDEIKRNILDGLFHIAMADDEFHPNEEKFLEDVADVFGVTPDVFSSLKAQHVPEYSDPWGVLGVSSEDDLEDIKAIKRQIIRECHPDVLRGKGLPQDMVALGEARIAAVTVAYDEIVALKENIYTLGADFF